jgi:hypothetical protein
MEAIIGLLELAGGVILAFAAGYTFARISGYGEYYDKIFYDEESDADITIQRNNQVNDKEEKEEDLIYHVSI